MWCVPREADQSGWGKKKRRNVKSLRGSNGLLSWRCAQERVWWWRDELACARIQHNLRSITRTRTPAHTLTPSRTHLRTQTHASHSRWCSDIFSLSLSLSLPPHPPPSLPPSHSLAASPGSWGGTQEKARLAEEERVKAEAEKEAKKQQQKLILGKGKGAGEKPRPKLAFGFAAKK
jgi:hypothetical protein